MSDQTKGFSKKHLIKFAQDKLQKGINYLQAQTNAYNKPQNSSHPAPQPPPPPPNTYSHYPHTDSYTQPATQHQQHYPAPDGYSHPSPAPQSYPPVPEGYPNPPHPPQHHQHQPHLPGPYPPPPPPPDKYSHPDQSNHNPSSAQSNHFPPPPPPPPPPGGFTTPETYSYHEQPPQNSASTQAAPFPVPSAPPPPPADSSTSDHYSEEQSPQNSGSAQSTMFPAASVLPPPPGRFSAPDKYSNPSQPPQNSGSVQSTAFPLPSAPPPPPDGFSTPHQYPLPSQSPQNPGSANAAQFPAASAPPPPPSSFAPNTLPVPSDPPSGPQSGPQSDPPPPSNSTGTAPYVQPWQSPQKSDPIPVAPFSTTPPPPAPFTEPFSNQPAPPPNPTPHPLPNAAGPIITQDLLFQMDARLPSAVTSLGASAVTEARKGLSRLLTPTTSDIELFATQLKNSDTAAVEPTWNNLNDNTPCFAISYVHNTPQGRYKFSQLQWQNLHAVVAAIAHAGVTHFRLWLDQCLWIRDASQASWAHTGILPYVLWPVIALGAKLPDADRTVDTYVRMWPFVEQIAGLWGMGLIIASEHRDKSRNSTVRSWLSYNLRLRTEPEHDVKILLLNIFHGATDGLETGWQEDVRELKEMAVANIMYRNKQIIIGSDWRSRFQSIQPLYITQAIDASLMPEQHMRRKSQHIWLEGSRTLKCQGWNGVREWLSGNETLSSDASNSTSLYRYTYKYNVITNGAEYQLLMRRGTGTALWLLVAMQGRSSNFSRGRVAWTKVLTGRSTFSLGTMITSKNVGGVQRMLQEQLNNSDLQIVSMSPVSAEIQWM